MGRTSARWIAAAVLAAAGAGLPALGDVIALRDGTKITGTISRKGDSMVITRADNGKTVTVPAEDVAEVQLTSTLTPAELSDMAWKKLQVEIGRAGKLEEIFPKLEKFAGTYAGTPAADNARNLLTSYKQLAAQDPLKFRGQWVAKAQIEVLTRAEAEQAKPAIAAYKAGKMKEALELCRAALKESPQNPNVLAVAGLASYRANTLQESREFFLRQVAINDASLLGYNNLGVVSFQLQRPVDGLTYYGKALQIAPEHRLLLDNVTEAMQAAASVKSAPQFAGVQRQYQQAETLLEAKMAKEGVYRYGSSWVTQNQRDRLISNKTAVQNAMGALDSQYGAAVRLLDNIDARLKLAQDDYNTAFNNFNTWNAQFVLSPYYDTYSVSQRDNAALDMDRAKTRIGQLEDQRSGAQEQIRRIKRDGEKLKVAWAAVDKDQYTGIQRIMDLGDEETVPPPAAILIPPEAPKEKEKAKSDRVTPVDQIPQQTLSPTVPLGGGVDSQYGWVVPTIVTPVINNPPMGGGFVPTGGGIPGGTATSPPAPIAGPTVPVGGAVPTASPGIPTFIPAGPPTPPPVKPKK
jgi:tetratricopeptide (TPR) repeat protein